MKRFTYVWYLVGLLAALLLTGCSLVGLGQPTPISHPEMTAIAESIDAMRMEITSLAPTITALAAAMDAIKTVQVGQTQTAQFIPTLTPAEILPATMTSTPGSQAALQDTPAARPALPIVTPLGSLPTVFDPGSVILEDNFSSPFGWYNDENPRFTLQYADGSYRMFIMTKNNPIWSVREKDIGDVVLEVDAQQTGGAQDSYYGLVCRFVDGKNYYMLVMSEEGNARIVKVLGGKQTTLAQTQIQAGSYKPGEGNRLKAECISENGVTGLTFYINDTFVLNAQDNEYQSGRLGMVAGNTTTSGVEVIFDNLVAKAPSQ